MRAESLLPWDQVGRAPTGEDYRDIIMVAGKDPYAYKGTMEVSFPYMRKPGPTAADLRAADANPAQATPLSERRFPAGTTAR